MNSTINTTQQGNMKITFNQTAIQQFGLKKLKEIMISRDGENHKFNQRKNRITDIINSRNDTFNAHMWLEDDEGNIYDYSNDALSKSSMFGTTNIVRVPFEEPLFSKVKDTMIKRVYETSVKHKNKGVLKKYRNFAKKTVGMCCVRAYFKKLSNPNKWTIKVGSLGFKHTTGPLKGDIFYEFG